MGLGRALLEQPSNRRNPEAEAGERLQDSVVQVACEPDPLFACRRLLEALDEQQVIEPPSDDGRADLAEEEIVRSHLALVEHEQPAGNQLALHRQREHRTSPYPGLKRLDGWRSAPSAKPEWVVQQNLAVLEGGCGRQQSGLGELADEESPRRRSLPTPRS